MIATPPVGVLATVVLACGLLAGGCAGPSLKPYTIRPEASFAMPPATDGVLAEMATRIAAEHGEDASGFMALDGAKAALDWRLALIDSAVSSIDVQMYIWYPDHSGRLLMERVLRAAERGVKVRLIFDDVLTVGMDQAIAAIHSHPNIEFRLFNPWTSRNLGDRLWESIVRFDQVNVRMHNKLIIVDGVAVVVGGRNIGDHYFGLSPKYNFHDLDLLAFGDIGGQANKMFDHFWNSQWVVSAESLSTKHDPVLAEAAWQEIQQMNREAEELSAFSREVRDWQGELAAIEGELHIGTSELNYDEATVDGISVHMAVAISSFFDRAEKEVLINNAYIIPGPYGVEGIKRLTDRGVTVRILTNSLASHDVPAVNSHYKEWRDDLIEAGAELYEMRPDAAVKSIVDVPPIVSGFVGLHTKAAVIDRRHVFVGSMNFDPRSININAEGGTFVDSPALAHDLAMLMERDMAPENAWQVLLDADGKLSWVNSDETVYTQPARNFMQRVMDVILKIVPKDYY